MRILIIGAGIFGASTAYHLAREGADVLVVDANHSGKGTLAGAGIACPWVEDDADIERYRLCIAGARYHRQLLAELASQAGADIGFAPVGALVLSEDQERLAQLEARLNGHRAEAPEIGTVTPVPAARARQMFPPLRDGLGGLSISGGARVDGKLLTATLMRAAIAAGATVHNDNVSLERTGNGVRALDGSGNPIAADQIIVTSGVWAPQLLSPLGIAHPVTLRRGQISHLGLNGIDTRDWPVVLPLNSHYFVPFDDSRLVVGATFEADVGFDYRVTAAGQHEVLTKALTIAPGLADATLIETRIGFRPFGPTDRPIFGRAPGFDNLILGNGLAATGLTIGPYCGKLLADLALGRDSGFDITPFAPR
ncbi:MAG: FAD-binding oxidoreductase [Hyphomicrobiales bacterium]|nr:MAG: FAD-binding oxidoreductase [Hyphomicrobiales bacterium]